MPESEVGTPMDDKGEAGDAPPPDPLPASSSRVEVSASLPADLVDRISKAVAADGVELPKEVSKSEAYSQRYFMTSNEVTLAELHCFKFIKQFKRFPSRAECRGIVLCMLSTTYAWMCHAKGHWVVAGVLTACAQ